MTIVSSFTPFLQVFFLAMTEPTANAFLELVTGWLFAPGRSLADRIRAIPSSRSPDTYYRVLASASWSIEEVGLRLLKLILRWAPQETLFLVGDDTLLARKGSKIFGAGMHRDGCLSTRQRTIKRWGHAWVVLSVVIQSRASAGRYYSLPVLMQLYLSQATAQKLSRKYRKKTELLRDMLRRIERELPEQKLHFLGDYGYTAPAVLRQLPRRIEVTGRAHPQARLYEPAPPRRTGRGRPRIRGERLASPQELLEGRAEHREFEVAPGRRYRVRLARAKGCFFQTPDRLVQVVALEHVGQRRQDEAFYTTCTDAQVEQVVRWYARRWSIEVTFRDAKQHLAVGREQNRTRAAARRTAAMGFLMYSLVVLWHEFAQPEPMLGIRDYPGKRHASFADMLAALRRASLCEYRRKHFEASPQSAELQKNNEYLEKLLILAA
jgi:DDE superfamily endonuclease